MWWSPKIEQWKGTDSNHNIYDRRHFQVIGEMTHSLVNITGKLGCFKNHLYHEQQNNTNQINSK